MLKYQHIDTYGATNKKWLNAISDMEIVSIAGQHYLFTITQLHGGGITSHKIDKISLSLTQEDVEAFPAGTKYQGDPKLTFFDNSIQKYLYLSNLGVLQYLAVNVLDNGQLDGFKPIASPEQFRQVTAFGQFETSTGSFVYSAFKHDLSFHIAKVESSGKLISQTSIEIPLPYPHEHTSIEHIFIAKNGDRQFLVALSSLGDFIASYEISNAGKVLPGSLHSGNMGVGYRAPTDGVALDIQGVTHIVVAAIGSSTLTVLRIGDDGKLKAVDHILDERTTRFERITALEAVTIDDRHFIFVGGRDGGISVFTLQPNAVLLHLTNILDTASTTLSRVSDIEAQVINGKIELFVSSSAETGITQFRFDPGKIGRTEITVAKSAGASRGDDLLVAGPDTVRIIANDGDDILVSGKSSVRLEGGAGADIFVPTGVKGTVTIQDFEPGIDRLDFSQLGIARSTYDLRIKYDAGGAVVVRHDTKINIRTKDKSPLTDQDITNALFSVAHYNSPEQKPIFLPPLTPEELLRPYLLGEIDTDDDVFPDPLIDPSGTSPLNPKDKTDDGEPGPDKLGACFQLNGLAHTALLEANLDDDIKTGTSGNDLLDGGEGYDIIIGAAGKDVLTGGPEQDIFIFNAATESTFGNGDTITDFKSDMDIIDLRNLDVTFIDKGEFTGGRELRWFGKGRENTIQADINGDKIADFEVTLIGRITLSESDFLL